MKFFKVYLILFCLGFSHIYSQSKVAITIDDVPNTKQYLKDSFNAKLLHQLDSLKIPVAIFINEGLLFKTNAVVQNFELLNEWIKSDLVELGNHTYSHLRYSELDAHAYIKEVEKGEHITRALAEKYDKSLTHFRFPYNDLGKDSIQQKEIADLLKARNYTIMPFTVESSDWMFSYLYNYYLAKGEAEEAEKIGASYVNQTLAYFDFFDRLTKEQYGRAVNHIYLCHDSQLNADYLGIIIKKLQDKNYTFIGLTEALQDEVYQQPNLYHKKWGISWVYRWMKEQKERVQLMRQEPESKEIYKLYQKVSSSGKE